MDRIREDLDNERDLQQLEGSGYDFDIEGTEVRRRSRGRGRDRTYDYDYDSDNSNIPDAEELEDDWQQL